MSEKNKEQLKIDQLLRYVGEIKQDLATLHLNLSSFYRTQEEIEQRLRKIEESIKELQEWNKEVINGLSNKMNENEKTTAFLAKDVYMMKVKKEG